MNKDNYKDLFDAKYQGKFELMSEYVSSKDNVLIKCLICGKTNVGRADHVLQRERRCPHCSQEKLFKKFSEMTKDVSEDFVLVNYKKQERYFLHKNCGRQFKIKRKDFKNRCPICDEETKYLLTNSAIGKVFGSFTSNKTVNIDGKIYYFDFYIPYYDLYIDLYGDYIRFPFGRPELFISYEDELNVKKKYMAETKTKYLLLKDRTDILEVLFDFKLYFKKRKCTYKHFNRWRVSQKIK